MAPAIIDWLPVSFDQLPMQLVTEEKLAEPEVQTERFDYFELESSSGQRLLAAAATRAQLKAAELGRRYVSRRLRQLRRYDAFQGRVVRYGPRKTRAGFELPAGDYLILDEPFWVASGAAVAPSPVHEVLLPPDMAQGGLQRLWGCLEMLTDGRADRRLGVASLSGVCREGEPRARRHGHRVWFHQGIDGGPLAVVVLPSTRPGASGHENILVFRPDGRGKAFVGRSKADDLKDPMANRFLGFYAGVVKEWVPASAQQTAWIDQRPPDLVVCKRPHASLTNSVITGHVMWSASQNTLFWVAQDVGVKRPPTVRVLRDARSEMDELTAFSRTAS